MDSRIFLTSQFHYVAEHVAKQLPTKPDPYRVALINTAVEVIPGPHDWLDDNKAAFEHLGMQVFEYTISDKTIEQLREDLAKADIIYVEGGNTFYLLYQCQHSGFIDLIREWVPQQKIYISSSAGSIIAGPDIAPTYRASRDEWARKLEDMHGFSLVDFVPLPHWGQEQRRALYQGERFEHTYNTEHAYIPLSDYHYIAVYDAAYRVIDPRHD